MTYGAFLIGHPLFWASLSGAAFGVALASATRNTRRDRRPARSRSRKWSSASLWATFAVLAATGGIFVPAGVDFIGWPSLYVGLGALVFFAIALRFPRACGIPAVIVLAAVSILGPLIIRPYVPVRETGTVATVQLLSIDDTGAYLEVHDHTPSAAPGPGVEKMASPGIVAQVDFLEISDYLFFLGASAGIALTELRSADVATTSGAPTRLEFRPASDRYAETPFIESIVDWLPLILRNSHLSEPARLRLLTPYEIVGLPTGEIRIEAVVGPE